MKLDYEKLLDYFSHKNRQSIFLIIGIAGIILISAGDMNFLNNKNMDTAEISLAEYKIQLEKEITELLAQIYGVGEVKVMITLESGEENIYAEQEKSETDSRTVQNGSNIQEDAQATYENELVIISSQNENQPIIEKTLQPQVQGVAVVCSGADDISVVSAVTNTVSVVLNISTNRICVTKMR